MRRAELLMLLLCCRLGRNVKPLSNSEYHRFAQRISHNAPMLGSEPMSASLLQRLGCSEEEAQRIEALLQTEALALRYLQARPDVTVFSRLSPQYPSALRRLPDPPPALFCLGDVSVFSRPMVSLVGNRRLCENAYHLCRHIGQLAAENGFVLVSGNAIGADQVAQRACLHAGGQVLCFVPGSLPHRPEAGMLYCSDEGYQQRFSTARALRRNHYIHTMGTMTFVAQCREAQGGTWDGALYNLQHNLSPLWIPADESEGSLELLSRGAHKLPEDANCGSIFGEYRQFQ